MLATRFIAIAGATLLTGIALAAATSYNPFQESPKVEQHDLVLKGVGEWEGTVTMDIPGMEEPMVMPCTESISAIGELWTVSRFEGDFAGMPFAGSSTFGYDPDQKAFVSTWVDSMTTRITTMNGHWDEKTESLVSEYEEKDPMTGEMVNKRSVCKWSEDSYVCKFYTLGETEVLAMTIEMHRKKTVEASADAE
ncbi:MAG: DUF1579 family protein [Planctomycetes bacterium]|nr:DUF1579 family protein [Planctomycetota bacterium]